jgi:hypothetical protein
MLMGHAIAHELGHLLLGTSAHARYGLMAGRWRSNELDRAEVGSLQFSPAEAACLQRRVAPSHDIQASFGSKSALPMMVREPRCAIFFVKGATHLYRASFLIKPICKQ